MKHIGMYQIDALVLHPRLAGRTLPGAVFLGISVKTGVTDQNTQQAQQI
jgi:hypothetical protein